MPNYADVKRGLAFFDLYSLLKKLVALKIFIRLIDIIKIYFHPSADAVDEPDGVECVELVFFQHFRFDAPFFKKLFAVGAAEQSA